MSTVPEGCLVNQGDVAPQTGSLLSRVSIIAEREGGLIDAMVPVELINREEVPVDQDHVAELVASIRLESDKGKGTGQLSPILIGEVNGSDKFLIIDGFHRDASLYKIGVPSIFATIRTGSTLEEVLDLRILTANTHSSVTFARINEWIGDAWARTPWANRLTVVQAFALTKTFSTGKILGLSTDEAAKIKGWVVDKCDKWRTSPSTVHISLGTAELADPLLVKEARRRTGGHALTEITPQHLGVIAKGLPRRYAEQRLVSEIAKKYNMNVPTTRAVVGRLREATTYEEALQIAQEVDWRSVGPAYSPSRARELAKIAREQDDEAITAGVDRANLETTLDKSIGKKLLLSELQLSRVLLATTVLRGNYVVPIVGSERPIFAEVDVTQDNDIKALVVPADVDKNLEAFFRGTEKNYDRLLTILENPSYGLTSNSAERLIRDSSIRVTTDIERGDLRFVELGRLVAYDLLINAVRDELQRRKQDTGSSPNPINPVHEALRPSIADVIRGMRVMHDNDRRALTAHGILGLTASTTAALINEPVSNVPLRILDAQRAINEVLDKKAQKTLAKIAS